MLVLYQVLRHALVTIHSNAALATLKGSSNVITPNTQHCRKFSFSSRASPKKSNFTGGAGNLQCARIVCWYSHIHQR